MPKLLNICLTVFLASFLLFTNSFAASTVEKTILDNGLTVLVQPMPSSEVVSIYAYVKTGSATEGQFSGSGISHFVEHMLFKGTSKRAVGAIANEVKSLGGNINASTTLDYTMYTLDIPRGSLKEGLDIISDMLINSQFDPTQVEKEREVVHGEMRLYKDRPERQLSEDVFRNVFIRHPYRHPIIGYPMLFDGLTRDNLFAYYRERYIPNNTILSIAGAVKSDEALKLVKESFKDFKSLPFPERNATTEPAQISARYFENHYSTNLYRFSIAYQGVSLMDPDLYAMDVLAMALGQGEGSRLYRDVYKKQELVRSITASNFTPVDRGIFEIEGVMDKDNLDKTRASIGIIIESIKQKGLHSDELTKTKRRVLSQYVFSNQTSSSLAYRAALDEAVAGDPQFSKQYVDAVKSVTNDDIKRVARRYLVDSACSVTYLKPKESASTLKEEDVLRANPIQRIVLDNGLTVLLKEDHSVGVVAINAAANGGLRQETEHLNGVSQLFVQTWTKGTRSKKDEWIIAQMESRGGSVGGYAGRNTVGLSMQILSDDIDFGIELFADIIQNPTFSQGALSEELANLSTAIDARDDDVSALTDNKLKETLFQTHPYRLDLLGSKASLKSITRQDILDYYQRFIAPENMVISVFGDFDSAKVSSQIKRQFQTFKPKQVKLTKSIEPPPQSTRTSELNLNKDQAVVMFGFQAPAIKAKDRFDMEIVDTILGAGLSGRLFVKVRDELGKAYRVGSDYIPGIDMGIFKLFVLTTNDKIDTVRDIVVSQLRDLSENPVSDDELKSAKAYLKGTFKMGLATPAALGSIASINELYGLGHNYHEQFDALVDGVTKEDIQRVVRQFLSIDKAAIVTTTGHN